MAKYCDVFWLKGSCIHANTHGGIVTVSIDPFYVKGYNFEIYEISKTYEFFWL